MIRLLTNTRGSTAVEFALVAPVFLSMLFLTIEGSRLVWHNQALKDVAFATARCMSVDATNCDTDAKRKTFAVTHAARSRIVLTSAQVAIQPNTICDSNAAQNRVTITKPFRSAMAGFFPSVPTNIVSYACFPTLT